MRIDEIVLGEFIYRDKAESADMAGFVCEGASLASGMTASQAMPVTTSASFLISGPPLIQRRRRDMRKDWCRGLAQASGAGSGTSLSPLRAGTTVAGVPATQP